MPGFETRTLATRFVKWATGDYQVITVQGGHAVVLGSVQHIRQREWLAYPPGHRPPSMHLTRRGAAQALVDYHLENNR